MSEKPLHEDHRAFLSDLAHRAMIERGLLPDYSAQALSELAGLEISANLPLEGIKDQRDLPWCSIDNRDSRDLDQLSVAEAQAGGRITLLVAIADVDALVKDDSAINAHARHNTCTVYTAAEIFFMIPQRLSTDLSSLNLNEDRLALVMEMTVGSDGTLESSGIYRALVRNKARLNYGDVAEWLDGEAGVPKEIAAVPGLEENLRLQDAAATALKKARREGGALEFESRELRPKFSGNAVSALETSRKNRAQEMVENMMIAANGVVARFLLEKNFPSIRRVVRKPRRWDRIAAIALERGARLPAEPDPKALSRFLSDSKAREPADFAQLSLSVIKLLGAGEYAAQFPGDEAEGHFGLAVKDYSHSTAPNRRYSDLVTHRLVKAALAGGPVPYSREELELVAASCTAQENTVNKVERQVEKSAAALLLESRIGQVFEGSVTGAAEKGTWIKLLDPSVEGRVSKGFQGLDVGDRIKARLVSVDAENGYIDFERV